MGGDDVANPVDPHGPGDVLDLLLAQILEGEGKPISNVVMNRTRRRSTPPGSASPSNRAATFTPSPKMSSASAITSPRLIPTRNSIRFSGGVPAFALGHPPLHLNGAPDGVNHARELGQEAVAGVLHDPAPVLSDLRINQLPEVRFEPLVGPLLIRPHQARIPRHVGGEDRGEAADRGHDLSGGRLA